FLKGFYLIGRQHNNQVLAVSSLLAMVLLPLVNMIYLLGNYYAAYNLNYMLFVLLCINEIVLGIGFLFMANKSKTQYRLNLGTLYKIAGCITILQSVLFLSPDTSIVSVGLVIS